MFLRDSWGRGANIMARADSEMVLLARTSIERASEREREIE